MLYERWREIARENPDELALHDLATDERWTFSQLAEKAERSTALLEPIIFPQGRSAEFIFAVLRAWRSGKVVCPLEEDQPLPKISEFPKRCAHLKITSATTGEARFVAFTEAQLAADAENIVATMKLRRDWPNLGVISLAHSYGFSNLVTPLLLHGIPLVLVSSPLPEVVRRAALKFPFLTLAAVPALWRTWFDANAVPENVRLAISAGAPLALKLEQEIFARSGIKIHNFYGSTECGGIAYDSIDSPREDATCVGSPMRNVNLSVNENGCLEVRSNAVGETYFPVPNETLASGRFETSDLAEICEGKVYLRGRASDQINIAGRKVSPETIERALLTSPDVRECLVFGAPNDDDRVEKIIAVVVGNSNVCADSLKQFLLDKIPSWQIPREWIFRDSLQPNSRGKLSRSEWRKVFCSERKA
jgi:long-chain acyl-CoA synthetase